MSNSELEYQHPSLLNEHPDPLDGTEAPQAICDIAAPPAETTQPRTPSDKNIPLAKDIGETPCSFRASQSANFHNVQLRKQKERVAKDHQRIPCMSLQQFRQHALPTTITEEDINKVIGAIDIGAMKEAIPEEQKKPHPKQGGSRTQGKKDTKVQDKGEEKTEAGLVSEKRTEDKELSKNEEKKGAEFVGEKQTGDEKEQIKKEPEFFEHIAMIYNRVASVGRQVLKREEISKINYTPNIAPMNLECQDTATPDCNLVLATSTSGADPPSDARVYSCDVFATCEFKKGSSANIIHENRTQLIWNMRHIMQEDPCRRFVYGISIEGTSMRIWHANRADIFVSEPFNYVENLNVFVGILIQMMFANKTDLGWDDSIIRIAPGTYRIRVGNDWYESKQVLSNRAAGDLTGHASRIWLATVVKKEKTHDDTTEEDQNVAGQDPASATEQDVTGEEAEEVVIKDSWPELHMMPEHEIQELLLSKVPKKYYEELKERLFTIRSHEKMHIDGKEDNTLGTILHGLDDQTLGRMQVKIPEKREGWGLQSSSQIPSSTKQVSSKRRNVYYEPPLVKSKTTPRVRHRYHYRMVMKEVGTPVWRIDDLEHALIAYCDAFIVVSLLSACGWVHRDISSGNVYYYGGRGIVGDFEYAKPINSSKRSETRTGTRDFMAVEVATQEFMFAKPTDDEILGDFDLAMKKRKLGLTFNVTQLPHESEQRFFHHPLHDAESVWWGCIQLLFKRRVECSSLPELQQQYKEKYADLSAAALDLFPDESHAGCRSKFLKSSKHHAEIMSHLPPSLRDIGNNLSAVRRHLMACYTKAEQTGDGTVRAEVYNLKGMSKFVEFLADTRLLARGMKLSTFPKEWDTQDSPSPKEKNATQPAGSKRKTSEPPGGSRKVRRIREESASEAQNVNAIEKDVLPFPPCTLVA